MTTKTDDWYTLDTLTFMDLVWCDFSTRETAFRLKVIEGMTSTGRTVEVKYYAEGDYLDR